MDYSVVEFGKLGIVPAVGSPDKVAGDALKTVDCPAAAMRAFLKICRGILVAAIHAAVTVVVDRTITYVITIHQVYYITYCFGVMGCIAVDLDIEDMSSAGEQW